MLTLAGVDHTSTVLDIGCGDGRVCLAAAIEKGARGIGLESLEPVYQKALELRDKANMQSRVDLYHSNFMESENVTLQQALDRSNVIFVFLLPSDMQTIINLTVESIRRKYKLAMKQSAVASSSIIGASSTS